MTLTDDMEWLPLNTKNSKTKRINQKIEEKGKEKHKNKVFRFSLFLHVILFTVLSYELGLVIISQNCLANGVCKNVAHFLSVYILNCLLVCFIHSSYFYLSAVFRIFLLFTLSSYFFFNHFIHSCYPPRLARSFPSFTSLFLSLLFSLVTYHVFLATWKEFLFRLLARY